MVDIPIISKENRPYIKINKETARSLLEQIPREELLNELSNNDPFLWIYNNVPTEYGEKLDFSRRPYLVQIIKDFSPHIVYKKSAQVGITMCGGIAKCLYAVDTLKITSIYTFPTAKDVSDFSKARFRHIIHNSRYLHSRIGDIDSVGMVRFNNNAIYFKGAFTDRQATSTPSHLNIHDELDFSNSDVRQMYSSRLDAAEFMYNGEMQHGWEWDFSTPTLPKFGISKLYDESDQHEWWVKCDSCNRRQRVNFFKNMRKRRKGDKYFGCRKCDNELDRTKGEWVPRKPGASIRGYHITQPMCAFINANKMYKTYETSKHTSQGKRKFYNFNLGLEYEDSTETITRSLVLSRVTEGTVSVGPIFIGADQGDILHIVVSKLVDGVRRIIWIGTVNSFEEFEKLVIHYRARVAVIDGLPNHHNARMLSKSMYNVYAAYYAGTLKLERKYWVKNLENKEIKIPRTDLLDRTATDWTNGKVVIENYIPPNFIEDFAEHMSNAKRAIRDTSDGGSKAEWVAVGDDHYRHADSYNWLASEIGNSGISDVVNISKPYKELEVDQNVFREEDIW